nr:hypothetical protein [Tanacetum cinerariifolium]
MSFLTDYKEIDRGYVFFGGNPKGGKITGKGSGPNWLFDIDALTKTMNYQPIDAQSNDFSGTKASNDVGKEKEPDRDYILLPLWIADSPFSTTLKSSQDHDFQPSNDGAKRVDEDLRKENECNDQEETVLTALIELILLL